LLGELESDGGIERGLEAIRGHDVGEPGLLRLLGGQEGDAQGDFPSQRGDSLRESFPGIWKGRHVVEASGELDDGISGKSLLEERLSSVEALLGEGLPDLRGDGLGRGVVRRYVEHEAGERQGTLRIPLRGSGGSVLHGHLHDGVELLLMGKVVRSEGHGFAGKAQRLDEVLTTRHDASLSHTVSGLLVSRMAQHDRGARIAGVEARGLFVGLRGAVPHLGARVLIAPLHGMGEGAAASARDKREEEESKEERSAKPAQGIRCGHG